MTKQRQLKQRIRERMAKTGERYAAARAHIVANTAQSDHPAGVLPGYRPTGGLQADTSVLCGALAYAGLQTPGGKPYSEALVSGLCGGIGFLYAVFEYKGHPPMLTLVNRAHGMTGAFIGEGLRWIPADVETLQTSGAKTAQKQLDATLDLGLPAVCVADTALLPRHGFPEDRSGMSPQLISVVGRVREATDNDGDDYWVDDGSRQLSRVSRKALAAARARHPKEKHRLLRFSGPSTSTDLQQILRGALQMNARSYDQPPVPSFKSNVGTLGLTKWQRLLTDASDKKGWPQVFASGADAFAGLRRIYDCIHHDLTPPSAGRPLCADYLNEAATEAETPDLNGVADAFRKSGQSWQQLGESVANCDDRAVRRACAIADRRAKLRVTGGEEVQQEMSELWEERAALADSCDLSATKALAIYTELAQALGPIIDTERDALELWNRVVR